MWKGLGKIETNRFILNFVYLRYWFNSKNSKSWFVKRGSIFCGGAASSSGSVFGGVYVHFWQSWRTLNGFKQLERDQLIWWRELPDQFFFGQKVRPVRIICFSFRCFGNLFPWKVQRVPDLIKLPCLRPPKAAASTLVWWVWLWKRFLIFWYLGIVTSQSDGNNLGDCRCELCFLLVPQFPQWLAHCFACSGDWAQISHQLPGLPISSFSHHQGGNIFGFGGTRYGVDNFRHI